jgi:DNA-binding response OmpR family regulator
VILRVLLVEDEPELSESLVEVLEEEGYRVRSARGFAEARREVETFDPQTVVVDYRIAGEDSAARIDDLAPHAGIVLISAPPSGSAVADRRGIQTLGTPFDVDDLLALLARVTRPPM